jgi:hypothetical protein
VVGHVASSGRERKTVAKILFEVGEALVAHEILFRGEGNEIGTLALATKKMRVLGVRELSKAGEIVFAIKLEQGLEGREASEVEGLCGLKLLDLGGLTLKNNLVLLVARAKGRQA